MDVGPCNVGSLYLLYSLRGIFGTSSSLVVIAVLGEGLAGAGAGYCLDVTSSDAMVVVMNCV